MRAILISITVYSSLIWGTESKKNEEWGTLFFSKEERNKPIASNAETIMHYQGILKSTKKKPTYWLNNRMQQSLPNGVYLKKNHLIIQQKEKQIILAPGEKHGD